MMYLRRGKIVYCIWEKATDILGKRLMVVFEKKKGFAIEKIGVNNIYGKEN